MTGATGPVPVRTLIVARAGRLALKKARVEAPNARLRDFIDFPKVLLEQSAKAQMDFRMILSVADVARRSPRTGT